MQNVGFVPFAENPVPVESRAMSEQGDDAPKIQIDSDWKAQAQAEKDRLREQEEAAKTSAAASGGGAEGQAGAGERGEFPAASWETLMGSMVSQAMMYMGAYADPRTGQPMIELDAARHYVDLLGVLEEKTKGNLEEEEAKNLSTVIYELRMRYVQISKAVSGMPGGAAGGGMGGAGAGAVGGGGAFGMGAEGGASNIGDLG